MSIFDLPREKIEELLDAPGEVKVGMGKLAGMMTSNSNDWETPQCFFDALNNEFHFNLDAAASMENHKVDKFFSIHQNAFRLQWHGTVWLNPPYSDGIGKWLAKAKQSAVEGATVVVLVPARTDTNAWFDHARMSEVRFIKGRLKFKLPIAAVEERRLENIKRQAAGKKLLNPEGESAPFPSALCIFRPGLPRSTSYWVYKEIAESPGWSGYQLE